MAAELLPGRIALNFCIIYKASIAPLLARGAESWWGCYDFDSGSDSRLLIDSDSSDSDSGSNTKYRAGQIN